MIGNTHDVIRLNSQRQRAAFIRRELRLQGTNVLQVADEAGLAWATVRNFANGYTRFPRMETVVRIFGALGYEVTFAAKKAARGTVRIAA